MRRLRNFLCLVLGGGLMAACGRDEERGGVATAPSLASTVSQCDLTTLTDAVGAAFTDETTEGNVQGFAQSMVAAFDEDDANTATALGFQILEAIDTAGRFQGTLQANSDLAIATFPCMSLGTATLPTDLTTELGTTGAFGVRGRAFESGDGEKVLAHDESWIIEPPVDSTWQDITTVEARAGITGATANLLLVLGKPGSNTGFVGTGDELLATTFDWTTIPKATFGNPYVVVGQCEVGGGFVQHFPAGNSNAEIFGFVQPAQCPELELGLEPAPRSLAERLFRAISPAPAYATALLRFAGTGGGSKPALSPHGIVDPGAVNLSSISQSPSKKGNVKNKLLVPRPGPFVQPKSNGGVPFKQAGVLIYFTVIDQTSSHADLCYNWSFSDDEGVADFPHAFFAKPGSVVLRATAVGTATSGEDVPILEAGATALSPRFNVDNSKLALPTGKCPVFDGTTYFTNILNPNALKKTFDSGDPTTYPPNYDVVTFPNP